MQRRIGREQVEIPPPSFNVQMLEYGGILVEVTRLQAKTISLVTALCGPLKHHDLMQDDEPEEP